MNNANDFSKRTATQVNAILKGYNLPAKAESLGDGRAFYIHDTSIKTRVALKKAGFIRDVAGVNDKGVFFKVF